MKERYNDLRNKAWELPTGAQKLALLEESIRIADQYLSKREAYDARIAYSQSALFAGYVDRLFVSFAWCISEFEKNPDEYAAFTILWHYKWVLHEIWRFPDFSPETIMKMFDDFRDKCVKYGYALNPYYKLLYIYYSASGHQEQASLNYDRWKKCKRDMLSDCSACDQQTLGLYHFERGHWKRGMKVLSRILDGKMSCAEIPHSTYSYVLLPLLELKEDERAAAIAKRGIRMIDGQRFLEEFSNYLEYYTVADLTKAKKCFEKTARDALTVKAEWVRFKYLVSADIFLDRWYRRRRRTELRVPETMTKEWVAAEAYRLAELFDRRNGNDNCQRYMAHRRERIERLLR